MTNYREHRENLDAIVKDLRYQYDREAEAYTFEWSSKEEYLEWKATWRAAYKELSKAIRELKGQRKEFKYEYRPKGNNTMQRRTKIGENPNHDYSAAGYVRNYRAKAHELMQVRTDATAESIRQRKLTLEEAA